MFKSILALSVLHILSPMVFIVQYLTTQISHKHTINMLKIVKK